MEYNTMDRNRFEIYWGYYLSIERMLEETRQYVSPSSDNRNTYSDEFTKIILLSCSEIDSILKYLCKIENIEPTNKHYSMVDYEKLLNRHSSIKDIGYTPFYNSSLTEKPLVAFPFADLDDNKPYANLKWWENYQKIKHERIENVELGNLENAVFSLVAYYIVIRLTMDYLDERSGIKYVKKNYNSNYLIPCI